MAKDNVKKISLPSDTVMHSNLSIIHRVVFRVVLF